MVLSFLLDIFPPSKVRDQNQDRSFWSTQDLFAHQLWSPSVSSDAAILIFKALGDKMIKKNIGTHTCQSFNCVSCVF